MKGTFKNSREKALAEIRGQFVRFVERFDGCEDYPDYQWISYRENMLEDAIEFAKRFELISQKESEEFGDACAILANEAWKVSGYEYLTWTEEVDK